MATAKPTNAIERVRDTEAAPFLTCSTFCTSFGSDDNNVETLAVDFEFHRLNAEFHKKASLCAQAVARFPRSLRAPRAPQGLAVPTTASDIQHSSTRGSLVLRNDFPALDVLQAAHLDRDEDTDRKIARKSATGVAM